MKKHITMSFLLLISTSLKIPEEQNNLTAGNFIRLLILPKKQMVFVTRTRMLQVWSLN